MALCRRHETSVHRFFQWSPNRSSVRTGLRSPLRTGVRTGGKLAKSLLSPMPAPFAGSAIRRLLYSSSRGCRFDARRGRWLALAANRDPLGAGEAATTWNGGPVTESGLLTEPLLNAGEAAQLLRVPRSTLYELVRTRGLPHIRIGDRALRFTRQDLETWVTENTYGTQRAR